MEIPWRQGTGMLGLPWRQGMDSYVWVSMKTGRRCIRLPWRQGTGTWSSIGKWMTCACPFWSPVPFPCCTPRLLTLSRHCINSWRTKVWRRDRWGAVQEYVDVTCLYMQSMCRQCMYYRPGNFCIQTILCLLSNTEIILTLSCPRKWTSGAFRVVLLYCRLVGSVRSVQQFWWHLCNSLYMYVHISICTSSNTLEMVISPDDFYITHAHTHCTHYIHMHTHTAHTCTHTYTHTAHIHIHAHTHCTHYMHMHTHMYSLLSQGCFGLLTALVTVLPRALDEHIGAIVPGVVYCLKLVVCVCVCARVHSALCYAW